MEEKVEINKKTVEPHLKSNPKLKNKNSNQIYPSDFYILGEAMINGLNCFLMIGYVTLSSIFAGNLKNSKIYVEAIGLANVYQGIYSYIYWGINAGNILI